MNERHLKPDAWSPLRHRLFRSLWIATIVSSIGTWMQSTAAAWLMTVLAPSPVMVSLVQTSASLPIFILALPAGALADVLDRRRMILFTQTWMMTAAAALGVLTITGFTTPWLLLGLTLLTNLGTALQAPAWQAIVPELVSQREVPAAVAINSAGFNVARAVGPALGGLATGVIGPGGAFLVNAVSYLGVLLVVFLWRRPRRESSLPAERLVGAMRTGLRYARHARGLQAVFIRSASFIVCASALMALLPLLARRHLGLSSEGYGLLLGSFGLGAVLGAVVLQEIRTRFTAEHMVAWVTLLFAGVLAVAALIHQFITVSMALIVGGASWLTLIASFNSSVQTIVPSWVRGRALAVYMLIFFGGMAGGSAMWGVVADIWGIPAALLSAAGGLVLTLIITLPFRLPNPESFDLTPSMHWPRPALSPDANPEHRPVLVMIEYRIDPSRADEFTRAMQGLRSVRLRDGAMRWSLFVDAADPRRYVEYFLVESWVEHLRQHERVTVADREIEGTVRQFHVGSQPPVVTHLLATPIPKREEGMYTNPLE